MIEFQQALAFTIAYGLVLVILLTAFIKGKKMSRIIEEPRQHIHGKLASELNEMSIRIKLHQPHGDVSAVEQATIHEARKRHPEPTMDEILDLIDRCRDEMNQCTIPFGRF